MSDWLEPRLYVIFPEPRLRRLFEVAPPERLVFTLSDQPGEDAFELIVVVLTDLGDARTEMVFEQRGRMSAQVRVVWGAHAQAPWALVSNDERLCGFEYAQRLWIDEGFRDLKRFGFKLEQAALAETALLSSAGDVGLASCCRPWYPRQVRAQVAAPFLAEVVAGHGARDRT